MTISAVIFDLDNTLYNEEDYFIEVFSRYKATSECVDKIRKLFQNGLRQQSRDVFGDVLRYLNKYTPEAQEKLFDLYKMSDVNIALDQDAEMALIKIKASGLLVGVLTNGVVVAQKNKVRCLALDNKVDQIIYAREHGHEKPATDSFQYMAACLGVSPGECVVIGDHPVNDIQGAANAGMEAIQMLKYTENSGHDPSVDCARTLTEAVNKVIL